MSGRNNPGTTAATASSATGGGADDEDATSSKLPRITKFAGESIDHNGIITVFAGDDSRGPTDKSSRVMVVIGLDNSSKTAFIDILCNVFYGVSFDTPFRYKIAHERFDKTVASSAVTKYVFYGAQCSFRPAVIDTSANQGSLSGISLAEFLALDQSAEIHSIALVIPAIPSSTSPTFESDIQQVLRVFPRWLREAIIPVITVIDHRYPPDIVSDLLQTLNLGQNKRFFLDLTLAFVRPVDYDHRQRIFQRRGWEGLVQTLNLLVLHWGKQPGQSMQVPGPSRDRKGQAKPLTIPKTIPEVREDSPGGSGDSSYRPRSSSASEQSQPILRPLATMPGKNVVFGSQPTVSSTNTGRQDYPDEFNYSKRYLYDPETRSYHLYYIQETRSMSQQCLNTVPRVFSPLSSRSGQQSNHADPSDTLSSVIDPDQVSGNGMVRGSLRSTGSDWRYTSLRPKQTTFGISQSPDPIQSSGTGTAFKPYVSNTLPPPKPPRVILSPTFMDSEDGDDGRSIGTASLQRPVVMRQSRLSMNHGMRRQIRSNPILPTYADSEGAPVYAAGTYISQRQPLMYAANYSAAPGKPRPPSIQPRPGMPRQGRQRPRPPPSTTSSSSSDLDCSKCCYYILAPAFIVLAIIAVIVTIIVINNN